jgi:UDP-glucose 4-epimerase
MSPTKTKILVTGGAGYIGAHAVLALQRSGYEVIVLDNLVYGHKNIVENVLKAELVVGDTGDRQLLDRIFATQKIAAVMHFAAYAYVGESMTAPAKYYRNNVANTLTLLEAMLAASVQNFVFSSTCATYGIPKQIPIAETHSQEPINPYGASKLMVERLLEDFDVAYDLKSVTFRYFNAAGADSTGLVGEDHTPETHLIPLVLMTAMGQRECINVFGTDYPTPDGTCIRDYIHVTDLARAHVLGLKYLLEKRNTDTFNLGNGNGFSVREVIKTALHITKRKIPVLECPRRPGDPAVLVGSSDKARKILGWHPQYPALEQIIAHAWQWHQQQHEKQKTDLIATNVTAKP